MHLFQAIQLGFAKNLVFAVLVILDLHKVNY